MIMENKDQKNIAPTLIFIFGGSGDLNHRKLTPALFNLFADGFLILLGLHIIGALKHQWLDKKPIFYRMGLGKPPKDLS